MIQEKIAQILEEEEIGIVGEDIYIEHLPDKPSIAVYLYDIRYEPVWDGYVARLQFRVRENDTIDCVEKAKKILEKLKYVINRTVGDTQILLLRVLSGIQVIGKIERFYEASVNIEVIYHE